MLVAIDPVGGRGDGVGAGRGVFDVDFAPVVAARGRQAGGRSASVIAAAEASVMKTFPSLMAIAAETRSVSTPKKRSTFEGRLPLE